MNSHSDVESSAPHPDSSDSSAEVPDSRSAPLRQSDAEDTTMGPDTTGSPEVESTLVEEPHAVAADAVTVADPDLTVDMRLEGLLDGFAQSLPPEQQDLDQTLPQTSLKPVADVRSDQSLRLESFSQSGSVRPRSIQSASEAGVTSRNVTSPDVEAPAGNMDYVTLDKLGQGGMGTVHLARQVALGREVALKQIHQRSSHRQAVRDEFLSEAILTGKLEHPNIVPVYEVGESPDGELFYAMKNVKGRAWDSTIDDLLLSDNLKILIDVCDAIAFAHAEGVIHRDLKPQNIMTGGFGEVLVLDWGLAVLTTPGEDVLASSGGTPGYMAPEMINPPFRVGPRSDVYLLGAILFRFLAGRVPHAGRSARISLEAAAKNEIVEPDEKRVQTQDPTGELLEIALQAMATDPADRYQTVREFQTAVRDFDAHQESLTLATRAGEALAAAEQSGNYTRYSEAVFGFDQAVTLWAGNEAAVQGVQRARQAYALCAERKEDFELGLSLLHESIAGQQEWIDRLTAARDERNAREGRVRRLKQWLVAAAVVMFVIVAGAAFWINQSRIAALEDKVLAQKSQARAVTARAESDEQKRQAIRNLHKAEAARKEADRQRSLAEVNEKKALSNEKQAEVQRKKATVAEATAKQEADNARRNLKVAERNAYYSDMLLAQRDWEGDNVSHLREMLARHQNQKTLQGFEWGYWKQLVNSEQLTLRGHASFVHCVVFSPDGTRLASAGADNILQVWDVATGQQLLTLKGHTLSVSGVAFSPDGTRIASASWDHSVKVWDAAGGQELLTIQGHTSWVHSVCFSPDGTQLASASKDSTVKVWDATTGQESLTLKGHTSGVSSVVFSPDGQQLASAGGGGTVKVWDAVTGQALRTLRGHIYPVNCVVFSPDGRRLASGGNDGSVKVWEVSTGQRSVTLQASGNVYGVSFSPDGSHLAAGSRDGMLQVWDVSTGQISLTLKGHNSDVSSVSFSPDGTRLASASRDATVKVWAAGTEQENRTLKGHSGLVNSVSFSPDGLRLVSGGSDGTVKFWDVVTGQQTLTLRGHAGPVQSAVFSPDGLRLASGAKDGSVKVWNASTGQRLLALKASGDVRGVAFSPDGKQLASASGIFGKSGEVKLWDAATGQEKLAPIRHTDRVNSVAFSPDGTRLASASNYGLVRVWNTDSGQESIALKGRRAYFMTVTFSPDGKRVASGSQDNTVRVWDVSTGQQLLTLRGHTNFVFSVAFSRDGTRLASASNDGSVKVWDAITGQESLTLKRHTGLVTSVAFSPDGTQLASASGDRTVRVWDSRGWTAVLRAQSHARGLLAIRQNSFKSLQELQTVLRSDRTINDATRKYALDWSELFWKNHQVRIRQQTSQLNARSWQIVRRPGLPLQSYRAALNFARQAARLTPDDGATLNTLGLAQYRVGDYKTAVQTLTRSERINAPGFGGESSYDLVFLAMTHYRLGEKVKAADLLKKVSTAVTQAKNKDSELQAFLSEADSLIRSPQTSKP